MLVGSVREVQRGFALECDGEEENVSLLLLDALSQPQILNLRCVGTSTVWIFLVTWAVDRLQQPAVNHECENISQIYFGIPG